MDSDPTSVMSSETDQGSGQLDDEVDVQPKNAQDPRGKRKSCSEIWDHFVQSRATFANDLNLYCCFVSEQTVVDLDATICKSHADQQFDKFIQ